ncbi:hypothetical protein KM043_011519 [Ampulex compressa]|nr:hypothetical protein KM043_011519 [Ampulex compressa]
MELTASRPQDFEDRDSTIRRLDLESQNARFLAYRKIHLRSSDPPEFSRGFRAALGIEDKQGVPPPLCLRPETVGIASMGPGLMRPQAEVELGYQRMM